MKLNVCDRIDQILSERKMSRRQLALKAGIPPSTLQSALARKKNMNVEMIQQIARALETSVNELLGLKPIIDLTFTNNDGSTESFDDLTEGLAFKRYLEILGYRIYGSPDLIKSSVPLFLYDIREDTFYLVQAETLKTLENHVNAFIKFQMCELIPHLEKLQDPELEESLKQTLLQEETDGDGTDSEE